MAIFFANYVNEERLFVMARLLLSPEVYTLSINGTLDTNPIIDMDVYPRSVFVLFCVDRRLEMGPSPIQRVLPNMCKIKDFRS
jgi:hypothetical protein